MAEGQAEEKTGGQQRSSGAASLENVREGGRTERCSVTRQGGGRRRWGEDGEEDFRLDMFVLTLKIKNAGIFSPHLDEKMLTRNFCF